MNEMVTKLVNPGQPNIIYSRLGMPWVLGCLPKVPCLISQALFPNTSYSTPVELLILVVDELLIELTQIDSAIIVGD